MIQQDYSQRLIEGNIYRQKLSRLKLSRLKSHRQKLHRLKPYRLRLPGWDSPGWSSIGSLGLPVLKIFKLQQCTFKLQQWGLGLKISNFKITTMVWGWGWGVGGSNEIIYYSISRKKWNFFDVGLSVDPLDPPSLPPLDPLGGRSIGDPWCVLSSNYALSKLCIVIDSFNLTLLFISDWGHIWGSSIL